MVGRELVRLRGADRDSAVHRKVGSPLGPIARDGLPQRPQGMREGPEDIIGRKWPSVDALAPRTRV